jgi:Uncharacterized alpha/beta hydrolase domain (DUF2235)
MAIDGHLPGLGGSSHDAVSDMKICPITAPAPSIVVRRPTFSSESLTSSQTAAARRDQVTMYDAGLGTDIGATALTAPGRFVQKLLSSVEGRGITTNIADCYTS